MSNLEKRLEQAWFAESGGSLAVARTIDARDELFHWERSKGRADSELRANYFRSGYDTQLYVEHALAQAGRSLKTCGRILEFASGFGRVTRHLVQAVDPDQIWTSEILDGAAEFSSAHFGVNGHGSTLEPEDLDFGESFDLIFVISLFSHLPEEKYSRFLRQLYSLLAPGGILLYSTHGPAVVPGLSADANGFGFQGASETLSLDASEYGTTVITPERADAIAREVGVAHHYGLERGLWGFQDFYVASNEPIPALDNWQHAPIPRGVFERCVANADRTVEIGGWVRVPVTAGTIDRVTLVMDGELRVEAELKPLTTALTGFEGGAAMRQFDWHVGGSLGDAPSGDHPLVAVAETSAGERACFATTVLHVP